MNSSQSPKAIYDFTVYAGYHQFYLQDESPIGSTGADDFWTKESYQNMIATNPGIIGVGTASYGKVPVKVGIFESQPNEDYQQWDHIAEASLELRSGQLLVCGCPDGEVGRIALEPSTYRLRIYYGSLDTVGDDETGDDYYRVAIWPADYSGSVVLKRWANGPR